MSLLAEEIVEEWLNRHGYFTIHGVKVGVYEMDLLAVRPGSRKWYPRHIEVQASVRPIGYVTGVPRDDQKRTGRKPGSVKHRPASEIKQGVTEWIEKKYDLPRKKALLQRLCPGNWSRELVVHEVKHADEIVEIERQGVTVHRLRNIVREILDESPLVEGAGSGDFLDLMTLFKE